MVELWNKALNYLMAQGVTRTTAIIYLIVGILLVVMAIVALIMRIMVIIKYSEGNKIKTSDGRNAMEAARQMLDNAGMKDVDVKKAGWIRAFFIGNCYSITQNTIFLRKGIADKSTITAVGVALQKVGVAKLCKESKVAKTRNIMQLLSFFGPIFFVPVVLAGFIVDYALFHVFGMFSIIALAVGVVLLGSGLISTLLSLPVEKKANELALKMIDEQKILTDEETRVIKKVFKAFVIAYICEFIIAVLRIVQIILEIVMNIQISQNKN